MGNLKVFAWCALLPGATMLSFVGCDSSGEGQNTLGSGGAGGQSSAGGETGTGGKTGAGGSTSSGGTTGTGGATSSGGTTGTGGATSSGGTTGTGGSSSTGGASAGGGTSSSGGTTSAGGATGNGGKTGTGGSSSTGGRTGTGGSSVTGGSTGTGGATGTGGRTSTGGSSAAGGSSATGGATSTGGSTGPCTPTWQDPPANVSAWINESWNDQLGNNVRGRKDWLIDNAMMGKGQINLCVRWGATSAPTTAVKTGMAAAVEKWLNDWFTNLADYGCFPYPHITAKVTGWAVKPGNESWVSDLDSSIKVYTETDSGTDPPGEPKCPDACSFFTNWSHTFPNCPGGEAFHTDYWLWLDDTLPGSGAAAVGGDWGLRMPFSNFVSSMGKSNLVIEHEMGHGFGFQDYYDWTGSTPAGGSLMIVGSTSSQIPTVGDQWLLRRTWKEMKSLRGW
jgi:hypothetical protein